MTPRANQIQEMIADIDKLLQNKGKRLWGVISSQEEPREVLQRVRDFLANEAEGGETSQAQLPPLVAKFMQEGNQELGEPKPQQNANNQLYELIEPVKAELKTLLEERANLVSEIRELEKKRLHDYSLAQQLASQEKIISEFMQVLRNRLEEDVALPLPASVDGGSNPTTKKALPASIGQGDSTRVENLAKLTNDLDQRLVALDGTVNVVFEALQRNIHAYHDSLSQSLARMHYKGVQGEQLLEVFIKNVANLSPAQVNSELIEQASDEVTVETIDAQSVESTETGNHQFNYDSETFENIESTETGNHQFNYDSGTFESDAVDENIETYDQDNNDNLVVTPDENIDNIEFSQAQENLDLDKENNSITPDFETAISQIEQDSVNEDDTEELETDNYLEIELTEETEEQFAQNQENKQVSQPINQQVIEQEIVKEPDAFDTPEKMQAVLSELRKSSSTEQLTAESSSDNANEDEVDELYASLFDSDNLNPSSTKTPPKQVITQAIDVENHPTSAELDSQLRETQTETDKEEKEVVSREVVFEYIPPTPTDETSESPAFTSLDNQSPENQSPMLDLWSGESTSQNPQENQTAPKTYKRKQAKSEDTINSLTELLFEEEAAPVENSQLKSQSKS
ncbi:MAG: hypothetical protein AAF349_13020, partial [Cyanobacteria bacterium P01_A01_bin.68]